MKWVLKTVKERSKIKGTETSSQTAVTLRKMIWNMRWQRRTCMGSEWYMSDKPEKGLTSK